MSIRDDQADALRLEFQAGAITPGQLISGLSTLSTYASSTMLTTFRHFQGSNHLPHFSIPIRDGSAAFTRRSVVSDPPLGSMFENAHVTQARYASLATRHPRLTCPSCDSTIISISAWEPKYHLTGQDGVGWEPLPPSPVPITLIGGQARASCGCIVSHWLHQQWLDEINRRDVSHPARGLADQTEYQRTVVIDRMKEDISRLIMFQSRAATLINKIAADFWIVALFNELDPASYIAASLPPPVTYRLVDLQVSRWAGLLKLKVPMSGDVIQHYGAKEPPAFPRFLTPKQAEDLATGGTVYSSDDCILVVADSRDVSGWNRTRTIAAGQWPAPPPVIPAVDKLSRRRRTIRQLDD